MGYRDVQATGQAQIEAALDPLRECPNCGHQARGSWAPAQRPREIPDRTPDDAAARAAALAPTWEKVRVHLRARLPAPVFEIWIDPMRLIDAAGDRLYVEAPAPLARWAGDRFDRVLCACASEAAGRAVTVRVLPSREDRGAPAARRHTGAQAQASEEGEPNR